MYLLPVPLVKLKSEERQALASVVHNLLCRSVTIALINSSNTSFRLSIIGLCLLLIHQLDALQPSRSNSKGKEKGNLNTISIIEKEFILYCQQTSLLSNIAILLKVPLLGPSASKAEPWCMTELAMADSSSYIFKGFEKYLPHT
ncbi:hypothetical protein G4B88_019403 [Cannabis sativa]|uniref:Uncharacterized protein n=1 Tax=Cannabis sativa TaxID=3483 RepID=A0A7J6HY24_CANSA|nr:hypothetical protein G4B88_019403 [Cannabis sativa]